MWLEGKFMHVYCLQRFPRMLQCLSKFIHIGNELEKFRMKLEKVFFCACIYHVAGCVFDRLDYRALSQWGRSKSGRLTSGVW